MLLFQNVNKYSVNLGFRVLFRCINIDIFKFISFTIKNFEGKLPMINQKQSIYVVENDANELLHFETLNRIHK